MTIGKFVALLTFALIIGFAGVAFWKSSERGHIQEYGGKEELVEIELDLSAPALPAEELEPAPPPPLTLSESPPEIKAETAPRQLPEADRVEELFTTKGEKFPIVETIVYKSRVPWLKGRPAWVSDYASYYDTSRHFIARSLNGKADYLKQDVADGARFNVFKKDYPISFRLVVDTSRCKLWLYYIDGLTNEKVLVKTYKVGLGRPDSAKASGILTPLGIYSLGNKVAVYKPSVMGNHKGQKVEMVKVFGSRWIPFEKEIAHATLPAKGYGIHGVPWKKKENGEWDQDIGSLGKYESDGCVRLATEDIEEIFAIVISKPSTIEIVSDFWQAKE